MIGGYGSTGHSSNLDFDSIAGTFKCLKRSVASSSLTMSFYSCRHDLHIYSSIVNDVVSAARMEDFCFYATVFCCCAPFIPRMNFLVLRNRLRSHLVRWIALNWRKNRTNSSSDMTSASEPRSTSAAWRSVMLRSRSIARSVENAKCSSLCHDYF